MYTYVGKVFTAVLMLVPYGTRAEALELHRSWAIASTASWLSHQLFLWSKRCHLQHCRSIFRESSAPISH